MRERGRRLALSPSSSSSEAAVISFFVNKIVLRLDEMRFYELKRRKQSGGGSNGAVSSAAAVLTAVNARNNKENIIGGGGDGVSSSASSDSESGRPTHSTETAQSSLPTVAGGTKVSPSRPFSESREEVSLSSVHQSRKREVHSSGSLLLGFGHTRRAASASGCWLCVLPLVPPLQLSVAWCYCTRKLPLAPSRVENGTDWRAV